MGTTTLLFGLAIVAGVWGIVAGIRICEYLRRRGHKVNFVWIRLMLPICVHRYGEITRADTGRRGPLFYHYVIAFNVALVAVLAAIIITII